MFDHVTIRASDVAASKRFYDTVLAVLGLERHPAGKYLEWGDFSLAEPSPEHPITRRLHVAFRADSRDLVNEFWRVGTEAGYTSDGEPGPRPEYSPTYYGAFVLDPDGNSAEAVHHDTARPGEMDHLWLRTPDIAAQKRFYDAVAPVTGWRVVHDEPERFRLTDGRGSFSFVAGEPVTEHVHLAFAASDNGTVDEFHRVALAAGYRDNGGPGERPQYHPGYYGAFVFDSDGHNVEAVFHDRR